jgi:hypothetical protein
MKKTIVLAVLGVAAIAAHAADWQTISEGPSGQLSINQSMLHRDGSHVLLWMKMVLLKPLTIGAKAYDTSTTRVNINCADDTTVIQSMIWTLNGRVVETSDLNAFNAINPDSVMAVVEKAVCR